MGDCCNGLFLRVKRPKKWWIFLEQTNKRSFSTYTRAINILCRALQMTSFIECLFINLLVYVYELFKMNNSEAIFKYMYSYLFHQFLHVLKDLNRTIMTTKEKKPVCHMDELDVSENKTVQVNMNCWHTIWYSKMR